MAVGNYGTVRPADVSIDDDLQHANAMRTSLNML